MIESICDRILWLDHGHLVEVGRASRVIRAYQESAARAFDRPEGQTPTSDWIPGVYKRALLATNCGKSEWCIFPHISAVDNLDGILQAVASSAQGNGFERRDSPCFLLRQR